MTPVIIARPTIEFQPALGHWNRRLVNGAGLLIKVADPLACTVNVPRPRIRRRNLETTRKAAVHAPLHGVVGRVSLTGANASRTKVRMKTHVVWLLRVDLVPGRELMALRSDVRTIKD